MEATGLGQFLYTPQPAVDTKAEEKPAKKRRVIAGTHMGKLDAEHRANRRAKNARNRSRRGQKDRPRATDYDEFGQAKTTYVMPMRGRR